MEFRYKNKRGLTVSNVRYFAVQFEGQTNVGELVSALMAVQSEGENPRVENDVKLALGFDNAASLNFRRGATVSLVMAHLNQFTPGVLVRNVVIVFSEEVESF